MGTWRTKLISSNTRVSTQIPSPCCPSVLLDRTIWTQRWLLCPLCRDEYWVVHKLAALELTNDRTKQVHIIRTGPPTGVPGMRADSAPSREPVCAGA